MSKRAVDRQGPTEARRRLSDEANTSLTAMSVGGAVGAAAGVVAGTALGVGSVLAAVAFPLVGLVAGGAAARLLSRAK